MSELSKAQLLFVVLPYVLVIMLMTFGTPRRDTAPSKVLRWVVGFVIVSFYIGWFLGLFGIFNRWVVGADHLVYLFTMPAILLGIWFQRISIRFRSQ